MKAYHTVQKTVELPYMLRSGMGLMFNPGSKKEWFTVKAQGYSKHHSAYIVTACNASVGIIIDGKSTILFRVEDNTNISNFTWKAGELQASLPFENVFYPVAKIDSDKSLCIFIPTAIHEKREVKLNDTITIYSNNVNIEWVVKYISPGCTITLVNLSNRNESVCIHPDDKELAKKFGLEFK